MDPLSAIIAAEAVKETTSLLKRQFPSVKLAKASKRLHEIMTILSYNKEILPNDQLKWLVGVYDE